MKNDKATPGDLQSPGENLDKVVITMCKTRPKHVVESSEFSITKAPTNNNNNLNNSLKDLLSTLSTPGLLYLYKVAIQAREEKLCEQISEERLSRL